MGKALSSVASIAGAVALVATGVGAIAGAGIAAAGIGAAAKGIATIATLTAVGSSLGASLLKPGLNGTTSLTAFDPKAVNADPAAPRKYVFGRTTFPLDMRYAEPSGTNQEFIDYVFALAAHKSDAIESIYIEDDLAWTAGGGAQGKYAGYLTVEVILEAGASTYHTVNDGSKWGASQRLTGCTTMKVRVKRSDNSKDSQSPFASGISGRWAVIGRGMPVYDPALDSTVPGGSGSQRANDQSTWAYTATVARGNNPALQLLAYLLGWRIGGVVSVGVGLPADTIDLPSFAAAAALCDESVALAGGGTQRRYEAGRAFSDADDPLAVMQTLLAAMNGELVDDGGRLALRIAVNDLTAAVTLTDDDFVSGYVWRPQPSIDRQFTVVRGRYSQPDAPSLFGLSDYPEVAIPRTSIAPRPFTLELSAVQDQRRAERIAKQAAQRSLYQGEFTVTLGIRGWLLRRNMVVAIDSNVRGWTDKLFRVRSLAFNDDGTVQATFREEDASIYAWDTDESASVTPVAPVVFDSRKAASWLMADIEPGATNTAPGDANRVKRSLFEGDQGVALLANASGLVTETEFGTFAGFRFFKVRAIATAADQIIGMGQSGPQFRVTPGERLSIQSRIEVVGEGARDWQLELWLYEDDGTTESAFILASGLEGRTIGDDPVQTFFDVPAGRTFGRLELRVGSDGAGLIQAVIAEQMVTGAAPGQTVHPAFTPGPNADDGATVGAPAGTLVGGQEAGALVADAATAKSNAASALSSLAAIANDAVLDAGEKPAVRQQRQAIIDEFPVIRDRADAFGVPRVTLATAYTNLIDYLAVLALDSAVDTGIVRSVFNGRFTDYFAARQVVLDGIAAAATAATLPNLPQGDVSIGSVVTRGQTWNYLRGTWVALADFTVNSGNLPPNGSFWRLLTNASDGSTAVAVNYTSNSATFGQAVVADVRTGPAGEVVISCNLPVAADPDNSTSYLAGGKWRREISPGTFTDVMTEALTGSIAPGGSAALDTSVTVTGLTPGQLYRFDLQLRRAGAGPGTDELFFNGIANLQGL